MPARPRLLPREAGEFKAQTDDRPGANADPGRSAAPEEPGPAIADDGTAL
jgi:hypothetical protein